MPIYDPHFNTTPPMPIAALVPATGSGSSAASWPTSQPTKSTVLKCRIEVDLSAGVDDTWTFTRKTASLREAATELRGLAEEIEYLSSRREP
jgi:hypothetical protein